MSDQSNELKEIINTFKYFINHYENELNPKPTIEDITNEFKSANFIEKTIKKLEENKILTNFMNCLNCELEKQKRTLHYDNDFYRFACDKLLLKYFKGRKYDIEIAVRMYYSFCDEKRFQEVVEKHIIDSGINESILNYVISNKNNLNLPEIQCRLMIHNLKIEISNGNLNQTKDFIENTFNSYKIDKYLSLFMGILIIKNLSEEEEIIKSLIAQILENKMAARSFNSKEFWLTLIQNTNSKLLVEVSQIYTDFLDSLLNFFGYCASLMSYNKNTDTFSADKDKSICPEITFDNILVLYQALISNNSEMRNYVTNFIESSKNESSELFWDRIQNR